MNTTTCTVNGEIVPCLDIYPFAMGGMIFFAIVAIVSIVSVWKIFVKAGKPGWASIIPIYNIVVMLEVVKKPTWYVILMFIPFVNIILAIVLVVELCKAFGKGTGFTFGMILLPIVFYPILAFDDSKYIYGNESIEPEIPPMIPAATV